MYLLCCWRVKVESERPVRQLLWESRWEKDGGRASGGCRDESRAWIPEIDGLWNLVINDIWKVEEVRLSSSHELQIIGAQRVLQI